MGKKFAAFLGVLASLIAVIIFLTGRENLPDLLNQSSSSGSTIGLSPVAVAEDFINWHDRYSHSVQEILEHDLLHPNYVSKLQGFYSNLELDYDPVLFGTDCMCCEDDDGKKCSGELLLENGDYAEVGMHGGFGAGIIRKVKLKKLNNRWKILDIVVY